MTTRMNELSVRFAVRLSRFVTWRSTSAGVSSANSDSASRHIALQASRRFVDDWCASRCPCKLMEPGAEVLCADRRDECMKQISSA